MSVLERVGQGFLSDVEKVFLPGLWKLRHFALRLKRSVKRRAGGRVLNSTFERLPKILVLQSLRAQRVHGPARFAQALPGQFAGAAQMIVCFLATTTRNGILSCFQLYNYTGETLREGIVNVSCHSIALFEDRSSLPLLGKLIELKREHNLMRERRS